MPGWHFNWRYQPMSLSEARSIAVNLEFRAGRQPFENCGFKLIRHWIV